MKKVVFLLSALFSLLSSLFSILSSLFSFLFSLFSLLSSLFSLFGACRGGSICRGCFICCRRAVCADFGPASAKPRLAVEPGGLQRPFVFWCAGAGSAAVPVGWGGRVGVFSVGSGGFPVVSPIDLFFHFHGLPGQSVFDVFCSKSARRGQIPDKQKKFAAGAASGPGGSSFGLLCSFLTCWVLGRGRVGLLLGTHVFVVVASWCWCVLHFACAFQVSFGQAWGDVWPVLAQAPACCPLRRPESHSALDDPPSKHDKYVPSPNGPKGCLLGFPFQLFFSGFTDNLKLIGHCHIYIYIYTNQLSITSPLSLAPN